MGKNLHRKQSNTLSLNGNPFLFSFGQKNPIEMNQIDLPFSILTLLVAGAETISTAFLWFLIHITNRPNIQEKIFMELSNQIGHKRQLRMCDIQKLPLLQAAILETHRYRTTSPYIIRQSTKGLFTWEATRDNILICSL